MKQLEHLDLSDNPVFYRHYDSTALFSHLTNLRILKMRNTGVEDSELAGIQRLPHLQSLDLSGNYNHVKTLSLQKSSSLKELRVSYNEIESLNISTLPPKLETLDARSNAIKSIKFEKSMDAPMLEVLKLSENSEKLQLPESMESPFVLQNLRVLEVDSSVSVPAGLRKKLDSWKN